MHGCIQKLLSVFNRSAFYKEVIKSKSFARIFYVCILTSKF